MFVPRARCFSPRPNQTGALNALPKARRRLYDITAAVPLRIDLLENDGFDALCRHALAVKLSPLKPITARHGRFLGFKRDENHANVVVRGQAGGVGSRDETRSDVAELGTLVHGVVLDVLVRLVVHEVSEGDLGARRLRVRVTTVSCPSHDGFVSESRRFRVRVTTVSCQSALHVHR